MRYKVTMCLDIEIDGTVEEVYDFFLEDKDKLLKRHSELVEIVSVEPVSDERWARFIRC